MPKRDLLDDDSHEAGDKVSQGQEPGAGSIPPAAAMMRILLLRMVRGGLGAIPWLGPLIVETTFGTHEQVALARALKQLAAQIDEIKGRLGAGASAQKVLVELKTQEAREGAEQGAELRALKPALELAAKSQRFSPGRLLGKRKLRRRAGLRIRIGGLEVGALFFPIGFLRQQLAEVTGGSAHLPDPFMALLEPEDHTGTTKWICVECTGAHFVVSAYPKPIRLDESWRPHQVEEVTVDETERVNSFQYWPDGKGRGAVKFVVEMSYGEPFELRFQEKGRVDSPLLVLALYYGRE